MAFRPIVTTSVPAWLLLAPAVALAQGQPAPGPLAPLDEGDVDEIVVTGSRIVRQELTATSPIAVVNADYIAIQNPITIEEVLRRSPQFAPAIGGQVNNGNVGAATLDLRNLGENRTLVLVDGKRFVPYDSEGIVDVNMIPSSLLERVEIVTGGASSAYGSDAVAGVVNFILKKDFEGIEVNALTGITQEGDGESYGFDVTTGGNFAGGRGNLVLNVGYTKAGSVSQADRKFSRQAKDELLNPFGSFTAEQATTFYFPFAGDPFGGCVQFDAGSNLQDCVDGYNFNPPNLFQLPQQRWTATALGRYDITSDVEFFTRASFANTRTDTRIAPTGTFFSPFRLNVNNAFLGPAAQAQLAAIDNNECDEPVFDDDGNLSGCDALAATAGDGFIDIELGRRLTELGSRDSSFENTAYQFVGGLRGNFAETQRWEVFAQYGRTARNQRFANDTSAARVQQALLAVEDDGNIVCLDPIDSNCVPGNFFGPGNLSGGALDYIRVNVQEINSVDQLVAGGSLTGGLPLTFPTAGDSAVSYAAGLEFRRENGRSTPDAVYLSGDALGFGASALVDAEIEIGEVFGELLVPVARDLPFAKAANLEAGIRFARYENQVGSDGADFNNTSFKFGGDWSPVDSLRFRAMFQRAVRAPTLQEIGSARAAAITELSFDPCEGANPLGNPALEQLCLDTGVPPARLGTVTSIIAGQIGAFTSGSVALQPEEADTVTVGFVLQPTWLPGFTASVDYYRIRIEDGIVEPVAQNVVNACYDIQQDPAAPFCQRIIRSPVSGSLNGGPTVGVDLTRLNASFESAEGLDFAAGYRLPAGNGELAFNLQATYIIEQEVQDAGFLPRNDCAGLVGSTCLRPYNEWNALLATTWDSGALTVQLDTRLLSGLTQDAVALGQAPASAYAVVKSGTYVYWDLRGQYDLNDTWTVRAGIDNLLDREPPIVGDFYGGTAENSGSTYPSVYDALGRAFSVGITARF